MFGPKCNHVALALAQYVTQLRLSDGDWSDNQLASKGFPADATSILAYVRRLPKDLWHSKVIIQSDKFDTHVALLKIVSRVSFKRIKLTPVDWYHLYILTAHWTKIGLNILL